MRHTGAPYRSELRSRASRYRHPLMTVQEPQNAGCNRQRTGWKRIITGVIYLLLCLVVICLGSCGSAGKDSGPDSGSGNSGQQEGIFTVYYLDRDMEQLYPVSFRPETSDPEDTEELIASLTEQFLKVPNNVDALPAAGDRTEYRGFRLDGSLLYVYFDDRYSELKRDRMTLSNAALTKTLCQVSGVEHVGIYSGDQMLQTKDGTPMGPFAAADFIDSVSNVNSYETAELTLYFANAQGTFLKEETRTVIYRMDTMLEEQVVEQLLLGPQTAGARGVFASGTRLLSLSVNENICYLNFNREFLTPIPDEDPNLTVYALVNSLTELNTVQRVQIAVEGSQEYRLRDTVPLDRLFDAAPEYLETEKGTQ